MVKVDEIPVLGQMEPAPNVIHHCVVQKMCRTLSCLRSHITPS